MRTRCLQRKLYRIFQTNYLQIEIRIWEERMLSRRGVVFSVLLMLSVISCLLSAFAQEGTATLSGRVTDPAVSRLPGQR